MSSRTANLLDRLLWFWLWIFAFLLGMIVCVPGILIGLRRLTLHGDQTIEVTPGFYRARII